MTKVLVTSDGVYGVKDGKTIPCAVDQEYDLDDFQVKSIVRSGKGKLVVNEDDLDDDSELDDDLDSELDDEPEPEPELDDLGQYPDSDADADLELEVADESEAEKVEVEAEAKPDTVAKTAKPKRQYNKRK